MTEPVPAVPSEVTTRANPNGWRLAAIGAVGVLAVGIGIALGAYLLGRTPPGGLAPAANYVPAGAAVYLELELTPSPEQDSALRELLGRFPPIPGVDLDRPLAEALPEALDTLLSDAGAEVSWQEDVAPWFGGTVAVAITDLASPTADPAAGAEPPFLVLVDVMDRAAAMAAVERLLERAAPGVTTTEVEHQGETIVEAGEGSYVITGDQLIVARTTDAIRAALDARASGEHLASSEAIRDLSAGLPADRLLFGVYDLSEYVTSAFDVPGVLPSGFGAAYEELLADQPTTVAYAMSAAGDRITFDTVSGVPTGEFAPENADRGLADEVPGDALLFTDGGNIGRSLAASMGPIKDAAAEADPAIAEQIETIERALGAELEELVAWIDDGALVAGWDGTEPYGGLILVPTDMAEAERRLDQLGTFAELAAMDTASGITVTEGEVGSTTVTTISWSPPPEMAMMLPPELAVSIQYAVTEDRALIGFGESFIARVLELDASESLAAESRYADAVAELGGATNTGVTWLDLAGTREALEAALNGAAPPDSELYTSAVRPWLLPLDRLVSVGRVEGDRLVSEMVLLIR